MYLHRLAGSMIPMDFLFLKERYIFFTSIILTAVTGAPEYAREGCSSGRAIEADGKQALIYTGVTTEKLPDGKEEVRQNQCIAWGDGKDYVKAEKNPVVTGDMLPEKCSRVDFRDPKVWEDNGTYHMLVGCRSEEIPGQVVLFSSKDLKEWKFETKQERSV